ncbi:uncharacterized protein [Atheta coriaria]|uniref:uncharacterized protein n=1 Tax=Dalotia coriaria TaxID=877792 RepID=UPI0031F3C63B
MSPSPSPRETNKQSKNLQSKRRVVRKCDAATAVKSVSPLQKRAKQTKKVNESFTKENFSDAAWFGPSNVSPTSPGAKSLRSSKSKSKNMRQAQSKASTTASGLRMENKNTKLSRKFASSNFHEVQQTTKVESYTGGHVVRLTSDSKQDWSVIMHTQKSPTRYELRQSSPLPANNILDEITLKDLEPLKAEYPRRDHLVGSNQRLEDTLLYKLVNGNPTSIETLVNVTSSIVRAFEDKDKEKRVPSAAQFVTSPKTMYNMMPGAAPLYVSQLTTKTPKVVPNTPAPVKNQAKGDGSTRAGIYRSQGEQRGHPRKPPSAKEAILAHSKRIAIKLSEIKPAKQEQQFYKQASTKDARRRLKKYIADPNKTHQKYMVMMVHTVVYDNYKFQPENGGFEVKSHQEKSPEDILSKYIYLDIDDGSRCKYKPVREYTVAIMTTPSNIQNKKSGTNQLRPTNDRESDLRVNRSLGYGGGSGGGNTHQRRGVTPTMSTPTTPKQNMGETTWKNVIRTCYQPPLAPQSKRVQMDGTQVGNKVIDPLEVKSIISRMELELKQVVEDPKIENKEMVIKGLQEQMEWILSTLEGQTTAIKKRRELNQKNSKLSNQNKKPIEKSLREPILKPVEVSNSKPSKLTLTLPPVLIEKEKEQPSLNILGSELKKTQATTTILPPPLPSECDRECQASAVSDEMQAQLMCKWQALEHPSGESLEIASLKDLSVPSTHSGEVTTPVVVLEPKKVISRPETRREGRAYLGNTKKSNSTLGSSQERFQTVHEGSLNRDGRKSFSNTEKMMGEILAKIQLQENEDKNEDDVDVASVYNSCAESGIDNLEPPVKENIQSKLTPEEIIQYQENIKLLESQLGEETQRFVDEMDEVIKQIESQTNAPGVSSNDILTPFMDAVKEYQNEEELYTTEPLLSIEYARGVECVLETHSGVKHVATTTNSIQINEPIKIQIIPVSEKQSELDIEVMDQATDSHPKPILPMTSKEISFTLSHEMRKNIKTINDNKIKLKNSPRDYDLQLPKAKDSPMIQDIRRSLFKMNTESRISSLQSKHWHQKHSEMSDKSTTTVSMTNLQDLQDFQEHTNKIGPRKSKSEITLIKQTISPGSSLKRTVELVESAISAKMKKFFNESGLSAVSDSVDSIVSAALAATLTRQQKENLEEENGGGECKPRDFGRLLTFVYSVMFTIMCLGLNWCPTCISS